MNALFGGISGEKNGDSDSSDSNEEVKKES